MALTRRKLLRNAGLGAASLGVPAWMELAIERAVAAPISGQPRLTDIEHVVILIQENRSFDHYFGTMSGVRGFSDPDAHVGPTGRSVFNQIDPYAPDNTTGYLMPWHLDGVNTAAQCLDGPSNGWNTQHYAWDQGEMDLFVAANRVATAPSPANGANTMGYFTRADLPFYYALADAFTVCDDYHCSVLGPTNPNRCMAISAWIDPEGTQGGPVIDDNQHNGQLSWETYPERLEKAGISWYWYQESDNDGNNMLPFFKAYADTSTELYRKANTIIPTPAGQMYGPALWTKLASDVRSGQLPQVSWILASTAACEHPNAAPALGEQFTAGVLAALTSDPEVWAKTILFLSYDENGGYFDHRVPPTPPSGTAGEYLSVPAGTVPTSGDPVLPESSLGQYGPVGLGFRVPAMVISPYSRGGYVCTDTLDHTSALRFLETRFGVPVPNLSAWRRSATGDFTGAISCPSGPDISVPTLPNADALAPSATMACKGTSPAPDYAHQVMPKQASGHRPVSLGTFATTTPMSDLRVELRHLATTARPARGGARVAVRVTGATHGTVVSVLVNGRRLLRTRRTDLVVLVPARRLTRRHNRITVQVHAPSGARTTRTLEITRSGSAHTAGAS
jgi:phospholipase C